MPCSRGCCASPAEHYRSIKWSHGPTQHDLTERQWSRDMPAYKSMRQQGLQPPSIDGAADLATRATSTFEIETGCILPPKEAKETMALLADSPDT